MIEILYIGSLCKCPKKEKMEERDMTRTAAREIAVRLAYELGYTDESAEAIDGNDRQFMLTLES